MVDPIPTPKITMFRTTSRLELWTVKSPNRNSPTHAMARPPSASSRYLPVRETSCPLTVLPTTKPTIIGASTTPESCALVPTTPCTKSGTNMIEPYMPSATQKVAAMDVMKMLFLKNAGAMIGSLVCSSCQTNRTSPRTPTPKAASTRGDVHGMLSPSQVIASSNGSKPITSSTIPA